MADKIVAVLVFGVVMVSIIHFALVDDASSAVFTFLLYAIYNKIEGNKNY